jgi:hypothetical protein
MLARGGCRNRGACDELVSREGKHTGCISCLRLKAVLPLPVRERRKDGINVTWGGGGLRGDGHYKEHRASMSTVLRRTLRVA